MIEQKPPGYLFKSSIIAYKQKTKLQQYEQMINRKIEKKSDSDKFKILYTEIYAIKISRPYRATLFDLLANSIVKKSFTLHDQALIVASIAEREFYKADNEEQSSMAMVLMRQCCEILNCSVPAYYKSRPGPSFIQCVY